MPTPEDELYLYLSVTAFSVSSVLVLEDSGTQRPVFYVSRVLHSAEIRYSKLEKLAFALVVVVATRRLRGYFQSHPITVLMYQRLPQVLKKPDHSRRLAK